MREGTIKEQIARHLLEVGQAYKEDVQMYGKTISGSSSSYVSKILKEMEKEEILRERKVRRERKRIETSEDKVLALTKKGK